MFIPFITLFYFYFLQFFEKLKKQNSDYLVKIFAVLVAFVLLQILRVYGQSVFPDIPNYNLIFKAIRPLNFVIENGYGLEYYEESEDYGSLLIVPIEIGFSFFISVFKLFSENFDLFLLLISFFQLSAFYIFCREKNINLVFNFTP